MSESQLTENSNLVDNSEEIILQNSEKSVTEITDKNGVFLSSLKRNNKQIRESRAVSIAEDTETLYRRKIEDLRLRIRRLERQREDSLDLSPTNATNLKPAENYNPEQFVENDLKLIISIKNEKVRLEEAEKAFLWLFGKKV